MYTVYEVNASRGHQVVLEQLGTDYDGVLVSDFYTAYNPLPYTQQKRLVHLLRELSDVRKTNHTQEYAAFAKKLTRLLRDAIRLKQKQSDFSQSRLERRFKRLNHRLEELAKADYHDSDCQRLAKRLAKHSDRYSPFCHTCRSPPITIAPSAPYDLRWSLAKYRVVVVHPRALKR